MLHPKARTLALRQGAGVAALLLLSSCSKKSIAPTPYPDVMGTVSASTQLVVYPDVPLTTYFLMDTSIVDNSVSPPATLKRLTCSADDSLVATAVERLASSATIHADIFDFTAASEYQAFRQQPNGTYRLLKDYPLQPTKRYPFGNADLFVFDDPSPLPLATENYIGRGLIGGVVTPSSPLTNQAAVAVTPTPTIVYTGHFNSCGDPAPPGAVDSLLAMSWEPVPGAAGYWVQVFQFGVGADVVSSRFPAPIVVGRTIDSFLAFFPATVTSYKIGDPLPAGVKVLTQKTLLNGTDYAVRITAVNDQGQLIAYPGESARAYVFIRDPIREGHYSLRSLGAFVVHTGNTAQCPNNPPCGQSVGTNLPNVRIYPPNGLPTSIQ